MSSLSLPEKHTGFLKQGALFLTRWQWLWLVFAAPFFLFPTPSRILFLVIIPVLWLVGWLATGKPLPHTPANLPLLVMISMVLVSLFATYDIAVSLPKIAGMLLGIGFFYAFIHASRKDNTFLLGLAAFLAGGAGIAILGAAGTQWPEKYPFLNSFLSRLPVPLKGLPGAEAGFQPNEVAGALLWVLPLVIVMEIALIISLFKRTKTHIWLKAAGILSIGIITLLVLGVLLLTQSRGSLLALVLGLILLPSIFLRWRRIYIGLLLLIFVILGVVSWRSGWIQKIYMETGNPGQSVTSLSGRVEIWDRAIMGIRDFPITGMGMNTFRYVVIVFYPTDYGSKDLGHAHNEFLQAALDLGIPGMIGFVSLNLVMFWMLVQTWRITPLNNLEKNTSGFLSWVLSAFAVKVLVVGLAGGFLAHLAYSLVDAVALGAKPGVMFWMLLGLITGLYLRQTRNTLTGTTLNA